MYAIVLTIGLSCYLLLVKSIRLISQKKAANNNMVVLLTGNFYSDAWIKSQLEPLSKADCVAKIFMVAEHTVPAVDKVTALYPPQWLAGAVGKDIARLIFFIVKSIQLKPDVVGGFHLLINGLVALFCAQITGCKSLYICGGGIREVDGGGYDTENRIFKRLPKASTSVEKRLLSSVKLFDFVVVRGTKAKNYFRQKGINEDNIFIITAGIDGSRYIPKPDTIKKYDIVFVGRISAVKRLNMLIDSISRMQPSRLVTMVVVGDGPDKQQLENYAASLGIATQIEFVGWQDEVEKYLQQSKVFALVSKSEGLSQAMLQAMLCGLPAVVTNVGDLADVIEDGLNGFLLDNCTDELLAHKFEEILGDNTKQITMGEHARLTAEQYDTVQVGEKWDQTFR